MARLAAILKAVALALWRDQRSLGSVTTNNFFLVTLLFLRKSGAFLYFVAGVLLLFPLSSDPLRRIPPARLALWPLARHEQQLLRVLSPWVNPSTWLLCVVAVLAARRAVSLGVLGLIALIMAAGFLLSFLPARWEVVWRPVPPIPGRLGQLVRKNLREMFTTLDFYCALIVSLSALTYRVAGTSPPAEAFMVLALLAVLAVSSYAQCLFGLDGPGGLTRYRLLPARGWQLLAAKGAAFLLTVFAFTLPLSPATGLAAGLIALAVGHAPSVTRPQAQTRWRFSTGASIGNGLLQAGGMALAGATTFGTNGLFLIPCACVYALSLWWYGRRLERLQ